MSRRSWICKKLPKAAVFSQQPPDFPAAGCRHFYPGNPAVRRDTGTGRGYLKPQIPADVSYLILRQTKDGTEGFTHTLFDRGAESLEYMVAADDTYLHPRHLPLIWE